MWACRSTDLNFADFLWVYLESSVHYFLISIIYNRLIRSSDQMILRNLIVG